MVKASQAFAALRQAVILELQNQVHDNLLPSFNAEVEDIRRTYAKAMETAEEAPTDVAREKLKTLAEANKKARVLDLVKRKNDFIQSLQMQLRAEQMKVIEEYKGEPFVESEKRKEKNGEEKERTVEKVKFLDGSVAKVAQNLFIDYTGFQRV